MLHPALLNTKPVVVPAPLGKHPSFLVVKVTRHAPGGDSRNTEGLHYLRRRCAAFANAQSILLQEICGWMYTASFRATQNIAKFFRRLIELKKNNLEGRLNSVTIQI